MWPHRKDIYTIIREHLVHEKVAQSSKSPQKQSLNF